MIRRFARFLLYQMNPEETRAVRPASITFASTDVTDLVVRAGVVDGEAVEIPFVRPRRVAGSNAALPALYSDELADLPPEIRPARVAAALGRLDPIDREIINYSLRRRVPDDALALLYRCPVPEFVRRRAAAVERLGDELGVGCGGHLLRALLDPRTWTEQRPARLRLLEPAPHPTAAARGAELVPWRRGALARRSSRELQTPPGRRLARRCTALVRVRGGLPAGRIAAAGLAAAAALATAWLVLFPSLFDGEGPRARESERGAFVPRRAQPLAWAFASDPRGASTSPIARITRATVLFDGPGGRPEARIGRRTEWGSPRVVSVVRRHGGWLGITAPELENGEVGWIEANDAQLGAVHYSLHADLSRRMLTVRHDGYPVRRLSIAIGAESSPTPTGRFAVTDKLDVTDRSSPYGCCVVVLSGHQEKMPAEWPSDDRLALHSTRDTESVGRAVGLGAMRTGFRQARWLMRTIPLGASLFVRR